MDSNVRDGFTNYSQTSSTYCSSFSEHKYMPETQEQNGGVLFTGNPTIFGVSISIDVLSLTERQKIIIPEK
jgi:hypothetical protein